MDFVDRQMAGERPKAGSYVVRFKKVLNSWCFFNDVNPNLRSVKIPGANLSPTLYDEEVPSQSAVALVLRNATPRAKAIISLLAFSGLRPESLGNYNGSDALRIKDVEGISIESDGVEFSKVPAAIVVRQVKPTVAQLSKKGHKYFTFIPSEGLKYLSTYLNLRIRTGEKLDKESPLITIAPRGRSKRDNGVVATNDITRDTRYALRKSGFELRPYVFRSYFETALEMAEMKKIIPHNWREYWAGHMGDISARYSTNKVLPPDMREEMRNAFSKCCQYIETEHLTIVEDRNIGTNRKFLMLAGFEKEEIEKMNLEEMPTDELVKLIRERTAKDNQDKYNSQPTNRVEQKVINDNEIPSLLEQGWEFVSSISGGKSIMKKTIMEYKLF
ncbi:MAG: integrase/recombinase [Thermoplasmatales archaeon I-plasma]|nr:MAG: integrase/recombinase [Thermoplasmatales archaeon I-plasma]